MTTHSDYDHILGCKAFDDEYYLKRVYEIVYPGHGQVTEDLQEIKQRQEESLSYIHDLRRAIRNNNQVEVDELIKGCLFPRFMKKAHMENQTKLIKEVEK
jgi:hydroxyacylglutathione hydrolase